MSLDNDDNNNDGNDELLNPFPLFQEDIDTETTRLQRQTEQECAPFFVELSSLAPGQREHLVQVGLLPSVSAASTAPRADNEDVCNDMDMASHVHLLRDKHRQYLQQVWKQPLKAPFVSLDSSRPWILYWCLHGYDLLQEEENENGGRQSTNNIVSNREGCNMVATLHDCWQSYYTKEPPSLVMEGSDPFYFCKHEDDVDVEGSSLVAQDNPQQSSYQYYCGGFGGGPGQLAHAATTYAAVLVLCILATDDPDDEQTAAAVATKDDDSDDDADWTTTHYSILAKELLQQIRIPLYRWMVSLQQPLSGGYRMHHDGEVDVRATYTIMTCAKLLGLLPNQPTLSSPQQQHCILNRPEAINFVISCQTYEGGMGGEPFSEAHGGYTFCGVAALKIMGALNSATSTNQNTKNGYNELDTSALMGWLARRQMTFEGGFSGRSNKLVDGCYSFWQGSATAIASTCGHWDDSSTAKEEVDDPWLRRYQQSSGDDTPRDLPFPLLFDVAKLERYILLCAQEITGGLRDKPSKPRDFYHTCYNLSGLSVAQHYSRPTEDSSYGDVQQTRLLATHPCYNIRIDRVAAMLNATWTTP